MDKRQPATAAKESADRMLSTMSETRYAELMKKFGGRQQ
jgi:hypothetical protein